MAARSWGDARWGSFTWGSLPPGYYFELDDGTDTVRLTEVLDLNFAREHTAFSDYSLVVPYDEAMEDWTFAEIHLFYAGDHLFAGEVQKVESDEAGGTTTISGKGAPGLELIRGDAVVTYTSIRADNAFQDYLDNHSPIGGTVTSTTGSTVNDVEHQNADTTSELNAILSPADTDPWTVASGIVEVEKTLFFTEAEDASLSGSPTVINRTDASGDGVGSGEGQAVQLAGGDSVSFNFNVQHVVPAEDVGAKVRWKTDGSSSHGREITLNGETLTDVGADITSFPDHSWNDVEDTEYSGPDLDPANNPHTLKFEATPASTDDLIVDCMAVFDEGGSRFTANYKFDNTLEDGSDGGRYLDGPEEYPASVRIPFAQVDQSYRITAVTINGTFNDTTKNQAIGWSVDGGSTWNDTANTSSISDDPVSTASSTITGSIILGRTADTRTTATPQEGFNGQTLDDWQLLIDGDTVGVIDDETVDGNHLENLQRLAKRAGVRFVIVHDRDSANWTIEAFEAGAETASASWDTINRKRTVDVEGYANKVIGKGAIVSGSRLREELEDSAEISALGQTVTHTFTDPSIKNSADLKSAVRVALGNRLDEDELTGTIDIVPKDILPGKAYTVSAWSQTLDLERVTYTISNSEMAGVLEFERPGGLGAYGAETRSSTREVRDAV